jgi:peptidoglycan/xylan/chitin deacetylase (PgdA/CDA1 family)
LLAFFNKGSVVVNMKNKKIKSLTIIALCILLNVVNYVYATPAEKEDDILEFVAEAENKKVAYITFDDGPSIYTEKLLDVLNEYEVPGIFFVLGAQFEYIPNADEILNRIVDEGHYIALHTMSHDKNALYWSEKSPATFTKEMLELRDEVEARTGHVTNLCRAPYGKKGHFKAAHFKSVAEAGLYCVDWHIDSKDWAKKNAEQIYDEVVHQLERFEEADEVVLLFHEYQRTVDVMPLVIEYLTRAGYKFKPYVEGKVFQGLN